MTKKNISEFDFAKGEIVLINKPFEWTSFDVVNKIRNIISKSSIISRQASVAGRQAAEHSISPDASRITPQALRIKTGHAGTLDPLATGLLIICTGQFTKRIDELMGMEKEYTGTFYLGKTTPSFDMETTINQTYAVNHITEEMILNTAKKFVGMQQQTPPAHSAAKVEGERAYIKARKGEEVILKPKEINISHFEITAIDMPEIKFKVVCSKGTYIRSIANDFGKALNSGAYLASLCRTRIGEFLLANAYTMEQFSAMVYAKPFAL